MTEGSLLAVRAAIAIVDGARAAGCEARRPTPAATATMVRMARADDPPPFCVPAPRRRTGLFVALGIVAFTLGYGIFGR
jgi:hypothetical protein